MSLIICIAYAAAALAAAALVITCRDTRTAADGRLLCLAEQDRARWDPPR